MSGDVAIEVNLNKKAFWIKKVAAEVDITSITRGLTMNLSPDVKEVWKLAKERASGRSSGKT